MYVEILAVSVLWFGILVLITACFIDDWKIALAFAPIFLLPYLVIASTVWGVKLGGHGRKGRRYKRTTTASRKIWIRSKKCKHPCRANSRSNLSRASVVYGRRNDAGDALFAVLPLQAREFGADA